MARHQDEYNLKITADAQDAQRDLEQVTHAERGLADETEKAGFAADAASGKVGRFRGAISGVGSAIESGRASWLTLAAVTGAILAFFKSLADTARNARDALIEVGDQMRGLAANVGGARADQIKEGIIDPAAQDFSLSDQQRNRLIAATSAFTDF